MQLHLIDWFIVATYLIVTLAIGLAYREKASQSLAEYFISGRSMPWWIAGTSMVATTFAADTPLAVTGLVAEHGLAGNWVWWSFALGGMLTVFVFARLWRRAEVMTDVELVELRYGGRPAAALRAMRAIYVSLIINSIIVGWVTKAMVDVLRETVLYGRTGNSILYSDAFLVGGLLVIVGVYCTLSGMWGVAMTDFFQFFTAMAGCIALAVVAVNHLGGIEALEQKVISRFPDGGQAFRFLPDVTSENSWMPWHIFLIYLFVQWWATWYPGAEPGGGGYVVQRMAACKDERHAVLATLWFQIAHYCLRPWPWLLVAFASLAMYPDIRQLAIDPALREQTGLTANVGYPRVIRDLSPVGLRGLMLVTFCAAYMSTISTQMNWGASYLVRDIYQRFLNPKATDRQLTRVSRMVSMLVLLVGGFVSAWMISSQVSVEAAWKLLLALGAGTGAVFILRWFWWRINAWSEIVAMAASLCFFILLRSSSMKEEEKMLCVAVATMATWLVATFITRPESSETLIAFYRKVRPGGPGWKPIAHLAPDVRPDQDLGISIFASIVASGIVFFTLPAIGAILFHHYRQGFMLLAAAGACTAVVFWLTKRIVRDVH